MLKLEKEKALQLLDKVMDFEPLANNKKFYNYFKKNLNEHFFFVEGGSIGKEKYVNMTTDYKRIYIAIDQILDHIFHYDGSDLIDEIINKNDNKINQVLVILAEVMTQIIIFYYSMHNPKNVFNLARHEMAQFHSNIYQEGGCPNDVTKQLEKTLSYDFKSRSKALRAVVCPEFMEQDLSSREYMNLIARAYKKTFHESLFSPKTIFDPVLIAYVNEEDWHWLVSGICVFKRYEKLKNAIFNLLY